MTRKQVWQYRCDFCGRKKLLSAGAMDMHEKRCTMNPNRICGMCAMEKVSQPDISSLVEILPTVDRVRILWPKEMKYDENGPCGTSAIEEENTRKYRDELRAAVKAVWDDLEQAANECPACILAAIRQSGCAPVVDWWKFNDARKAAMDAYNDRME